MAQLRAESREESRRQPDIAHASNVAGFFTNLTPPTGAFVPGDFILTHSNGITSKLIRLGQSLRYWGADAKYAYWSHAALIVSSDGELIEAVGRGIIRTPISHYDSTECYLVHLNASIASAGDREKVVAHAEWWHRQRSKYGFTTIISIAFSLLTGSRFVFGFDGQFTCSGLVAASLERTATIFDHSPSTMTPADLAKHFKLDPPTSSSGKGTPPKPAKPKEKHPDQAL